MPVHFIANRTLVVRTIDIKTQALIADLISVELESFYELLATGQLPVQYVAGFIQDSDDEIILLGVTSEIQLEHRLLIDESRKLHFYRYSGIAGIVISGNSGE